MDKDCPTRHIGGEKIILRPLSAADTAMIVEWRNLPFVMEKMIDRAPFTIAGHKEWLKTRIETGQVVQFIILENEGLRPVGSAYLRDIDYKHEKAELGIFIGEKDAQGKGYGTETVGLLTDYAFRTLGLHKVVLRFLAGNDAAEKSYLKAGFIREAYLRDEVKPAGEFMDVVLMAKIRHERIPGADSFAQEEIPKADSGLTGE